MERNGWVELGSVIFGLICLVFSTLSLYHGAELCSAGGAFTLDLHTQMGSILVWRICGDPPGCLYGFLASSIVIGFGWFGKAFWDRSWRATCCCMCGMVLCVPELCLVVPSRQTDVYAKI